MVGLEFALPHHIYIYIYITDRSSKTLGSAATAIISSILNTEFLVVDAIDCSHDCLHRIYLLRRHGTFPDQESGSFKWKEWFKI